MHFKENYTVFKHFSSSDFAKMFEENGVLKLCVTINMFKFKMFDIKNSDPLFLNTLNF